MSDPTKKTMWPTLKPGDIVDVIAPGSGCEKSLLKSIAEFIYALGLVPRIPKEILGDTRQSFLAQTDQLRLRLLKSALKAKDSSLIWCVRGGYGSIRLLPHLPKTAIGPQKLLIGYSDITSLHAFVQSHYGWPVLHGPLLDRFASGRFEKVELDWLSRMIFLNQWEVNCPQLRSIGKSMSSTSGAKKVRAQKISLVGGNLSVLQSSLGTEFEAPFKNNWLLLEDRGEKPHRVDRMLQHLKQRGVFKQVKGVILGDFTFDMGHPAKTQAEERRIWNEALLPFFKELNLPAFKGLRAGHGSLQLPIPLGLPATLKCNGSKASLHFSRRG